MHLKYLIFNLFLFLTVKLFAINEPVDSIDQVLQLNNAKTFYNKGIDYGTIGKLDSALIYTQKAVLIYESLRETDSTLLANTYQSLGIIYKILGQYDEAINCYDKSEKIYIKKNNQSLIAYIYGNKANIYFIQQDYAKAKDFHLRAYEIFKRDSLIYRKQIALTFNNLGNIYRKNNDFIGAINSYSKSLRLKNENDNVHTTIGNLALCYNKLQKTEIAKKYYLEAIKTSKKINGELNLKTAVYYLNIAIFISNQGKNDEALQYFYTALKIYKENLEEAHPDLSQCYNDIGEFYMKNNQSDSAIFYFQKSLIALAPEFNDTRLSSNPDLNQVLSKTHLLSALKNKANALSKLAEEQNDIANYRLSLQTFDRAIETIHKIRAGYLSEESKLFLADNEFETFSSALQTSYKLYHLTNDNEFLEKAFNYSEDGKSAILTEALKNTHALNIGGIPDSLITKEKQLEKSIWSYEELIYEEKKKQDPDQNKLEYWNKYLFEKKREFDDLTIYLEHNFQNYYALKQVQHNLSIDEVQKKLKRKDVLIEYFITSDKIYTIVIGKQNANILEQAMDQVFIDHLDKLLNALSNNNFSNHGYKEFRQYQESSFYIYNQLLKPIENIIKNKNLIIIPDGKLAYLPFEVLTNEYIAFDRINYKGLPYLLYKNHFSYSYSASFLFNNNNRNQTAAKRLGAFAPTYNNIGSMPEGFTSFRQEYRERLFPLKGIKDEVQKISELLHGDMYLDYRANEKTFKKVAPFYDILHLAMHTIMDDQNPMYSKMAFTQQEDSMEDGFLNTYELYNMKLNSRMAVLSSCNSGSGKMQRGEGVMSLARGFIYSGCPSIIMTLWSVEDKSGVKLMTSFYENLLKGKTKSESLQLSKIEFIEKADQLRAHPYFWSGYVVIGSNSALFESYTKYFVYSGITLVLATLILFLFLKRRKM
jgi:CHAT domain-containing protein